MTAVPRVAKEDFLALVERRFPDAEAHGTDINPEYGSWRIEVRRGGAEAHVVWGPLSGFGGTDFGRLSDDPDIFKPFDVAFESVEEAVAFVCRVLEADA
jgi:hypothetical protein